MKTTNTGWHDQLALHSKSYELLQVRGLYMMMGRGLERLANVAAGNIVAIGGLETAILKCATLSSTLAASPMAPMMFQARL